MEITNETQLTCERHGSTFVLTLNGAATRNSLSPTACRTGTAALVEAAADPTVRAVVLRGEGAHFCAGGNLQRLQKVRGGVPADQFESMAHFHGFVAALQACPLPVLAAVEGWAAGGGAALVLACDLVVAADGARFVFSYGRIGLSPDGGSSWQLARRLPRPLALKLLWLAEPMTARDWLAHGLVSEVVPDGQALAQALALATRLAEMAPNAVTSAKALVDAAAESPLPTQLDTEREHFVANLFHANGGEGLQAFIDKRAPRFT
jgi:enoyl-CoA hydratase/carnithine racemase